MNEIPMKFVWKQHIIQGFLHKPDKSNKILIMHHGFTGNHIDAHFMFTRFARLMAKNGIAVLRYDFVGSGNSTGEFSEMTFTDELEQAQQVFDEVKKWEWVKKIDIQGFSMGGALVTKLAANNNKDIEKLLLWSPAGSMPELIQGIIEQAPQLENGNYDCNGLEIGKNFIEEIINMDMFSGIEEYLGDVFILQGTNDIAVPYENAKKYKNMYTQNIEIVYIKNADHTYSSLKWLDILFENSKNFLLNNL